MGDVDFLVRKEDMERAGKVLEQEGFVPWDEEHICHVVYRRLPTHYEMHFEPAGVAIWRSRRTCQGIYEECSGAGT